MNASKATLVEGLEYGVVEGLVVVLCRKTGSYFGGNRLTTDVFELLLENPSVERLYSALQDKYEVEPETLRSDVDELLSQMAELGLVELEGAAQ